MTGARDKADEHCHQLVKQADKDRYLAALFAPETTRGHLLALYAFNIEIARVRELVSEPTLGEIRYKWWEDAIDGIYASAVPEHPVAQALARSVEQADLPRHAFVNMIEARRFDLYDDPMQSQAALEAYLGNTASALIRMGALVLAGADALATTEACGHAGIAYGMTGLLRSLPLHRSRGQCFIPKDLLQKRSLEPSHVLSGRFDAAMSVVLSEMLHIIERRLQQTRDGLPSIPLAALPAFLPLSLLDGYLKQLGREGFDPLHNIAEVSQLRRQWRLWRKSMNEEF